MTTLLDSKLSDWGRECINAWNKSLTTKGDSEADKKELTELYERAIDVYGSAALLDRDVTDVILAEIDNPQDKDAVVKWQDDNIGQRR